MQESGEVLLYFIILQHHHRAIELGTVNILLREPHDEMRFPAAMLLARIRSLSLADGLGGADNGGTDGDCGEDAKDHGGRDVRD